MFKTKFSLILIIFCLTAPFSAGALQMPGFVAGVFTDQPYSSITAQSYVVINAETGQVLAQKNQDQPWVPASLTKLVTALVVLDTNPKLTKSVAITQADQTAGSCGIGGACIKAKPGVKFTVDGLFHAALIPSANNAASALAGSTGLSAVDFVNLMNQKVASLGATQSYFYEPTGMNPANVTTASDFAKIVQAAFSNPYLAKIAGQQNYRLLSTNNTRYNQTIKNTDKLLNDSDFQVLGAKTGYLDEARHNFAAQLKDRFGNNLVVVLLGSQNGAAQFAETRQLIDLGGMTLAFNILPQLVLGTNTTVTLVKN